MCVIALCYLKLLCQTWCNVYRPTYATCELLIVRARVLSHSQENGARDQVAKEAARVCLQRSKVTYCVWE